MSKQDKVKEPLYNSKFVLKFDFSKCGLEKVKTNRIKQLGQKFVDNLDLVTDLMALPHTLLSTEHAKRSLVPHEIFAAVKARVQMRINHAGDEKQNHYFAEARKEVFETDVLPQQKKMIDEALVSGEQTLAYWLKDVNHHETYVALLYSAVVWIWCSFELLMKELWELTINIGGLPVSKSLLKNLPQPDKSKFSSRGKFIDLDYLAKYDLNLSKKLGSALLNKFDFTSPNGIKDAYFRAFPRSTTIKDALNNVNILELEANRNVIVHNAGIIDEEYCKKTNTDKERVREKLNINSRKVCEFIDCVIDVGVRIMIATSSIISHVKSSRRKQAVRRK